AVGIGQSLAQLLDSAQKLEARVAGAIVPRQDELRRIAHALYRGVRLLGAERVSQPQDLGPRGQDGQARAPVDDLERGPVDQHPLARGEFQNQPGHGAPPPRRPRRTARLMSTSTSTEAVPLRTLRLCSLVKR